MSDYSDKLLEHDYDGIRELDNGLPRWWVWLFIITVIWGVLYLIYYHVLAIGYLSTDEYQREIDPSYIRAGSSEYHVLGVLPEYHSPLYSPARDRALSSLSAQETKGRFTFLSRETDTTTYIAMTDPAAIAVGKTIFLQNCFSCHGAHGEGGIGPNLTDDYWLHGAGMTNVTKTIRYGYPTKGMLAWLGQLKPEQIIQVASFVLTLHGTNPPNPKVPQGDLVKEQ